MCFMCLFFHTFGYFTSIKQVFSIFRLAQNYSWTQLDIKSYELTLTLFCLNCHVLVSICA